MTKVLPSPETKSGTIETYGLDKFIAGTTSGLSKPKNEDRVAIRQNGGSLRLVLCDGHWGNQAAQIVADELIGASDFPKTQEDAIRCTSSLQKQLFDRFGKASMDPENDFTPETSFVAVELSGKRISIFSYGDCRLMITDSQGKIKLKQETEPTWLGAFSQLQLRERKSPENATFWRQLDLEPGDSLVMFSDGIDECVYEIPTIAHDSIAKIASGNNLEEAVGQIFKQVFENGAQDNASIIVAKI